MKEIFQISLSYDSVALKVSLKPIKRMDSFVQFNALLMSVSDSILVFLISTHFCLTQYLLQPFFVYPIINLH